MFYDGEAHKISLFFWLLCIHDDRVRKHPRSVLPELSAKGLHKHESVSLKASLNQIINYYTYSANIFAEVG